MIIAAIVGLLCAIFYPAYIHRNDPPKTKQNEVENVDIKTETCEILFDGRKYTVVKKTKYFTVIRLGDNNQTRSYVTVPNDDPMILEKE